MIKPYHYQILSIDEADDIIELLNPKKRAGSNQAEARSPRMKARLVTQYIDILLVRAKQDIETKGPIADITFADCEAYIEELTKLSNKLAKKLGQISQPDIKTHNTSKKYQIALLISEGMAEATNNHQHFNYTHFWKIKEDLELLHDGAQNSLSTLRTNRDKYYPISHPRDSFLRQSINAYKQFFNTLPKIYRSSNFVKAMDIALKAGNLELTNKSTFKLLKRANQQRNREGKKVLVW